MSSIFVRTSFSGQGKEEEEDASSPFDYGTRSSSVVLVSRDKTVTVVEWSRKPGLHTDASSDSIAPTSGQAQMGPDGSVWERRQATFQLDM